MNFILAYCSENKDVADEIAAKLQLVNIEIKHIVGNEIKDAHGLSDQLKDPNQPVILLVSDNFLKSTECMYKTLFMLQSNNKTQHIQPVIIDGRDRQNDGTYKSVPTNFDRVSNVIQYMNHWQEIYLNMRKEKREMDSEDSTLFDEKLKIIRSISSEVGEFLRLLRGSDFWTYDQLIHNEYELFFETLGRDDLHQEFKTKLATAVFNVPVESISEEVLEEIPEATLPEKGLPELETQVVQEEKTIKVEWPPPIVNEPHQSYDTTKIQDQENNPLLKKLMEYQKDRLEGKDMGDLGDDYYKSDIDDVVQEVVDEENNPNLAIPNVPVDSEEGYDIIQSIFNDDDEDDEEEYEEETFVEEASVPVQTNDVPIPQLENLDVRESIIQAQQLIQDGEIAASLALLQSAMKKEPENINLRFLYANCLIETTHEYEVASKELKKIIDIDPNNVLAHHTLADLAVKRHDYPLAKAYYERVISLAPKQPDVYFKLGMILNNNYDDDQKPLAAKYLKKAIKREPNNVDAHYHYALLLSDYLGNNKKAIKHLEQTLELDESHPFANYDLALIYHLLKKSKKASKYYRRACKINPELKTKKNDAAFTVKVKKDNVDPATAPGTSHTNPSKENFLGFTGDEIVEEVIPLDFLKEMGIEKETVGIAVDLEKAPKPPLEEVKTVLITGATSGIGRATAQLFASHGYRLILTGRRTNRLEELKKNFQREHQSAVKILSFDVRDSATVQAAIDHLPEEWRSVDILINNAGLARGFAPIHEGNLDHWDAMIDTNVKGLLYLTRAISPYMVKRRSGHIINLSSSAGKEVYPNGNVYCASKHAVEALTKAMRIELHKYNIRVSQISPGHVEETEFAYVRFEDSEKAKIYEDFQPLKASDVAEAIYFVVSRPAYVNIQDIVLFGTQQASNIFIDRSGRADEE